jgi:hypothetical protein
MGCPTLLNPACIFPSVIGHVAGDAAGGAIGALASAIQSGVAWMVSGTVDWWVKIPSPDLASEPAVGALQRWLLPVTVAVAVLAMISAAGKMALTRKANPLIDVGSGLAIIAATSALGVLLPAMLLKAGDAWSSWILEQSTGGLFGPRLTALLTMTGAASGVVVVLGIVAIILSAIQAVLMLFRQAALVVLAGVLPLAAAGTLTPGTRAWFRRVAGWMLALIFYKPAAAAVYATAFTMIGQGEDPRTILMGFAMVLLSLLALPVLMKFFTWTTGAVEMAAGGGGFLGTLVSGAIAIGALRASSGGPGGLSAADQARLVSAQLGPPGGAGPPGGGGPAGSGSPQGPAAPGGGGPPGGGPAVPAGAGSGSEGGQAAAGSAQARPAWMAGPGGIAAGAQTGAGAWMPAAAAGPAAGAASGGAGAAAGTAAGAAGLASGAAQAGRTAAGATQPGETGD